MESHGYLCVLNRPDTKQIVALNRHQAVTPVT